jgi:flagellar hook-length control protein FliK
MQLLMQVLNKEPKVEGSLIGGTVAPAILDEHAADFSELAIQTEFTIEEETPISLDETSLEKLPKVEDDSAFLFTKPIGLLTAIPVDFVKRSGPDVTGAASPPLKADTKGLSAPAPNTVLPPLAFGGSEARPATDLDSKVLTKQDVGRAEPTVLPKGQSVKMDTVRPDIPEGRTNAGLDVHAFQQGLNAHSKDLSQTVMTVALEKSIASPAAKENVLARSNEDAWAPPPLASDARVSQTSEVQVAIPKKAPPESAQIRTADRQKQAIEPVSRPNKVPTAAPKERSTPDTPIPSVLTKSEHAQKVPSQALPKQVTEVSTRLKFARSTLQSSGHDTIAMTNPAHSPPDSTQTIQVTAVVATDQMAKDIASGRNTQPLKEDTIPSLATVESSDARRPAEAVAPRVEPAARSVVTQLVQAARATVEGMVEVRLSPEELGRVRLSMTTIENGMNVLVTTERPETLDLIRRNIELFAADLAGQGFQNLNFSFGGEDAQGDTDSSSSGGGKCEKADLRPVLEGHLEMRQPMLDGRVDIRV